MNKTTVQFLGAAQNVTGSRYLVRSSGGAHVLVDCGLYQERALLARNWDTFPEPPSNLDAVILTHGHLDHCGLLPKLVREGFRGPVFCTPATAETARIVLADSARLQVEDAEFKRRRHQQEGRSGPRPELPLYTPADAEACFSRFETREYEVAPARVAADATVTFHDAGHILGSASVRFQFGGAEPLSLLFSGDIGRWGTPILRDPTPPQQADYVVMESTYGDSLHDDNAAIPDRLAAAVNAACQRGGNVLIPSFAIERAQELLFYFGHLRRSKRIPPLTVFLDSPMAVRVTEVFRRHIDLFDAETREQLRRGEHPCDFPGLVLCRTAEESKAINQIRGTAVILAGAGMCTGGRIKHHLAANLGRPDSTLLFVGYQAVGTLGRQLLDGAPTVRLFGQQQAVRLTVERISGFSAHADRDELTRWVSALDPAPRRVFVTHGEPETARAFAEHLRRTRGWDPVVPAYSDTAVLD